MRRLPHELKLVSTGCIARHIVDRFNRLVLAVVAAHKSSQVEKSSQVLEMNTANSIRRAGALPTGLKVRPCLLYRLAHPARLGRGAAHITRANPLESFINQISVAIRNSPINEGKKRLAIQQAGQYNEAEIRNKMERYIADNKVVVFSWSGCPFCVNAKALLREIGAEFTPVELDQMGSEGKAIRAELAKATDRTSMPNIWIKGQPVGGCNDGPGVATLHREGKLVAMLRAAGAL